MSRIGWNGWSSGSLLPSRDSTLYVLPFVVNRHRAHADRQTRNEKMGSEKKVSAQLL
jgi:hypothetical protein